MTYCPKCGKQNEDDATYCNDCGAPLSGIQKESEKEWEECVGGPRYAPYVWGLILVLIGMAILIEGALKNMKGLPNWIYQIDIGWIFALIIGLVIIIAGIRTIFKKD
jgi:hypothetical protein